jgi:HAD superfamily hydrolase (TIGR01509 family)
VSGRARGGPAAVAGDEAEAEAAVLTVAPDVVVLDVGEVLIDETRVFAVWAELLGVSAGTLAAVLGAAVVQGGDHVDAFDHLAPNLDWRGLEAEHEARYGGFGPGDLYPDVAAALTDLRATGVRIVLAGNQPARRSSQLRALDLAVDDVVTSDELGAEKPDAAFFAAVLARCAITEPARVLYVGDRVDNDVLPAAAAGMSTCWVRRGPWGQLQDLPDGVEPDLVLEGLGELPELVAAWRREAAAGQGDSAADESARGSADVEGRA